jgi:hypothetical protein
MSDDRVAMLERQNADLQHQLELVYRSSSWRITAPLRSPTWGVRRLRNGAWAWLTFRPGSRPHRVVSRLVRFILRRQLPQNLFALTSHDSARMRSLTPHAQEILTELKAAISLQQGKNG